MNKKKAISLILIISVMFGLSSCATPKWGFTADDIKDVKVFSLENGYEKEVKISNDDLDAIKYKIFTWKLLNYTDFDPPTPTHSIKISVLKNNVTEYHKLFICAETGDYFVYSNEARDQYLIKDNAFIDFIRERFVKSQPSNDEKPLTPISESVRFLAGESSDGEVLYTTDNILGFYCDKVNAGKLNGIIFKLSPDGVKLQVAKTNELLGQSISLWVGDEFIVSLRVMQQITGDEFAVPFESEQQRDEIAHRITAWPN